MDTGKQHIETGLLAKYFSKNTSLEEIRRVEEWIAGSEDNKREFNQLKQAWDLMDNTQANHDIDIEKEWQYLQNKIHILSGRPVRTLTVGRVLRVAASIVLLVGIGLTVQQVHLKKSVNTKLAETHEIVLPDNSIVILNARSKIVFSKDYGLQNRKVKLTGEAYFEVRRDTTRPFIVSMDEAELRVLGTSFNVTAYKKTGKIEVTVTEGRISLYEKDTPQKKVIAVMGEKAVYDRNRKIVKKALNADPNYMAWKTHRLIFENENLSTVADAIGKVYHRKILLRNDALGTCTLTTRFVDKDLETVLKVLESTFDIIIEQKNDVIYFSGEGCD